MWKLIGERDSGVKWVSWEALLRLSKETSCLRQQRQPAHDASCEPLLCILEWKQERCAPASQWLSLPSRHVIDKDVCVCASKAGTSHEQWPLCRVTHSSKVYIMDVARIVTWAEPPANITWARNFFIKSLNFPVSPEFIFHPAWLTQKSINANIDFSVQFMTNQLQCTSLCPRTTNESKKLPKKIRASWTVKLPPRRCVVASCWFFVFHTSTWCRWCQWKAG